MNIIDAPQGSDLWLQIRSRHFTASEAPAMLGISKYKTRQELLREKATGLTEEVDANKQRLFDRGHEAEAAARPLAEAYLQEDLFPATGAAEIDGLPLLASFDGLNMEGTLAWENKLANADVEAMIADGDLSGTYWPQCEQQLLVSGASRVLFTACDGEQITAQLWYESKPERRAQLIAGWKQFAEDLANYQHVEAAPVAVAAPIKELPTLFIQATGEVTATNMPDFKVQITEFLDSINMKPATDQEFADGKEIAKKLRELAKKIIERKEDMLAQTATIGEVAKEIDFLSKTINASALELEKAVEREEKARKLAIVVAGKMALDEHVAALNKRLGKPYMPTVAADFDTAIKGKRLLTAMEDAVATLLANKKVETSAIADRIEINLNYLRENAKEYPFLFADAGQIVLKANDDFEALAKLRISEHKEAEAKKLEAIKEAARIEAEAKVKAEAEAKAKAEQEETERQRKASEEAAVHATTLTDVLNAAAPAAITQVISDPAAQPAAIAVTQAIPPAPVAAAAPDNGRYIRLGELNALLGFDASTEFLAKLGFAATKEKNARLYRECDVPAICQAIIEHVAGVPARMRRAA